MSTSSESPRRRFRPSRLVSALLGAVLVAAGTTLALPAVAPTAPAAAAAAPTLSNAAGIFNDPSTWAAWATTTYHSSASSLSVISNTPQARWVTEGNPTSLVADQINYYVSQASAQRRIPVLTLYAIPHRDCGSYSSGGLANARAYADWVAQIRRGIAKRTTAIVLEPDALAAAGCLTTTQRAERYAILKAAVYTLSADPTTYVYIDAGHSHWHSSADIANQLKAVGVDRARGFSLNVSNFYPTKDEDAYGEKVSTLLGGKRYVVDTSRNGLGAATGALNWCNPAGRALGVKPTLKTGAAHADAYLWIKHPGESDGTCGRNEPRSGTWFNSYALGLVSRSAYRR